MPIATINPFNGETLRVFEPLTPEQLNDKLDLSAAAFSRFRTTGFPDRAQRMLRAAEILERDKGEARAVDHPGDGQASDLLASRN